MEALKALFAFAASSAIGLAMLIFGVLSLPFNVIAIMHIWHFEWWSALIIACLMNVIPFLGQFAYFVLAILGAYYFYDAGFSWQRAAIPAVGTFNYSQMTERQFEEYKKTKFVPFIKDACMRQAEKRFGFGGKVPARAAEFCNCYAMTAATYVTRQNISSQSAEPDGQFKNAVIRNCSSR